MLFNKLKAFTCLKTFLHLPLPLMISNGIIGLNKENEYKKIIK